MASLLPSPFDKRLRPWWQRKVGLPVSDSTFGPPDSMNPDQAVITALEAEWERVQALDLTIDGEKRYALRWVLVHVFGNRFQFDNDWCGLPVLVKRGPSGAWCGYVGVPPGHPWHGKGYSEALCGHEGCYEHNIDVNVHGGLTYAAPCDGKEDEGICHVPQEGEPADVWWLGFDCAHAWDISPRSLKYGPAMADEVYRDLAYVTTEARKLAEQVDAAWKV